MGYRLNGLPLPLDVAFKDSNGASYPANWLRNSSQSERDAVPTGGITWVADRPWYDQRFYWGVDKPKSIDDLKTFWIQKQKDEANSYLAKTDWLIIRKAEAGTAVPSDTTTYRAAVRTKCKEREDQITACSDTDALAELVNETETIEGTASNGATEKKKEDGSSYDPKQWNADAPNPAALKAWPKA